jgi:hypothetical protein
MTDFHAAMAEVVGYSDGMRGYKPDTVRIDSKYRQDYLHGFLRGRALLEASHEDEIALPDWINGEEGGEQ